MRKIFATLLLTVLATFTFAQVDSTGIVNLINTGITVADAIHPQPWVPGIDNNVISSLLTLIVSGLLAWLHRRRSVRKWKEQGKLK